jgi:IPT/TIG domain/NHL repeat
MKKTLLALLCFALIAVSCKKDDTPDPTPTPVLSVGAISPSSGAKNTVVTITGTEFGTSTAALKVYFNGVQGTVQTATNTSITATVPVGAGTGAVKVEKNSVQATGPVFTYVITTVVSTFAGNTVGYADGTGTTALFNFPTGIVKDAAGNFFVADRDNHRIRKMTPAGVITTFAGSGVAGLLDGTGTTARFNQPYGIAIDASDNIYIADRINHAIRKITPAGVVTTIAGNGTPGLANATGSAARFNEPLGLAVDATGNIFVADYINSLVRKVTPAGVVTTFAGNGFGLTDGTGTAASFNGPFGIAFDAAGNLFIGDYNNNAIRKITPAAVVSTFAGNGSAGNTDGTGAAARFNRPTQMAIDASGNMYVCDAFNDRIRYITAAGVVTTFAGTSAGNADGPGATASFLTPIGICADWTNKSFYIADANNVRIRKIVAD